MTIARSAETPRLDACQAGVRRFGKGLFAQDGA